MNTQSYKTQSTPAKEGSRMENLWAASRRAEGAGDIAGALDFHKRILEAGELTYASFLRAGWLHYLADNYKRSLPFYELAYEHAEGDVWPLYGMLNCHTALGNGAAATKVLESIHCMESSIQVSPRSIAV